MSNNFCGKCGAKLDKNTGLCPRCDAEKLLTLKSDNSTEATGTKEPIPGNTLLSKKQAKKQRKKERKAAKETKKKEMRANWLSGGELRAEVLANYLRHERLPDCTFLPENALYQRTYGTLPEGGVIIQQSHKRSQAARSFAA